MIAWPVSLVRTLVVEPQTTAAVDPELVLVFDGTAGPIDAEAQVVDVIGRTTRMIGVEIGGRTVTLEHDVDVVVKVEHTDEQIAASLRDRIVADLVLRYVDELDELTSAHDDATSSQAEDVRVVVSYDPLDFGTPNAYATLTFTVRASVSR